MKKLLIAAAGVAALAMAAPAAAETYGSIGYSKIDVDPVNVGAITGRFGWASESFFGVEGEASFGLDDDTVAGVKAELKTDIGVYAVARLPLNEQFRLLARVGYARTEVEYTPGGDADSDHLAWGLGAEWFFDAANGARLDWTQRDTEDDIGQDADVFTLSYVRRF